MIRQAISCDICGAEKKQAKHWFVAYEHAGELRVSGWNANGRARAGAKHLCGQTCLHKLVDEFIAGTMASRLPIADAPERDQPLADSSLTSQAAPALPVPEIAAPAPVPVRPLQRVPAAVIIAPSRALEDRPAASLPFDDSPNYASRRWRTEAWERERERCASLAPRRKTS